MLLWLQRAWSSYLRAAVIRSVENADVYKTSARISCCTAAEARVTSRPSPALMRQNPMEQALSRNLMANTCKRPTRAKDLHV